MKKQVFSKISIMLILMILLLLTPVFAAWTYNNYIFGPAESYGHADQIIINQFKYNDPGSVLPGGPGTIVTTPEETTPAVPPEETTPGNPPYPPEQSTPEQTTPTPPPQPEVPDGENHYNLIAFIIGDIGQEGLNIPGGIINRFIQKRNTPEYSEDNTSAGGNLPKEFAAFNSENLEFILTFNTNDKNPTICYAYTYNHIEQYDNDEVEGTYIVVYLTYAEYNSTTKKWKATKSFKGYAVVYDPPNKKVNWAPNLNTWSEGEIPE